MLFFGPEGPSVVRRERPMRTRALLSFSTLSFAVSGIVSLQGDADRTLKGLFLWRTFDIDSWTRTATTSGHSLLNAPSGIQASVSRGGMATS